MFIKKTINVLRVKGTKK